MDVRAVRGAIVVRADTKEQVLAATAKVVSELLHRNRIEPPDIVSLIFTATPDLKSAFPAEAARELGLISVPLLCAQEIDVKGAMKSVIRVLVHFETDLGQPDIAHVYLDGAEALRDDIA
jgi:chorismate mutase